MPSFQYPPNGGGPSGNAVAVNPARVIYVQPEPWPVGADPDKYVNTLAAAMTKAAALSPTPSEPVVVYVYPGTYPGAFVMVPWVTIKGIGLLPVVISGGWTYAPTDPVIEESIEFENVRLEGIGTIDTTGKAAGSVTIAVVNCVHSTISWTGRSPGEDTLFVFGGLNVGGTTDLSDVQMIATGALLADLLLRGTSILIEDGCLHFGELHTFDTAAAIVSGGSVFIGPVTAEPGTSISAPNCSFYSTVTAAAGASIDVRGGEVLGGSAALGGAGTIDRTLTAMTFGPTVAGANLVPFAVPYPNAAYNVSVTENAGAGGGAWPSVTLKTPTDFTLNDPTGGRTFDITVEKE
jgi:hypothetical protein